MDIETLNSELKSLRDMLAGRGYFSPEVSIMIDWLGDPLCGYIKFKADDNWDTAATAKYFRYPACDSNWVTAALGEMGVYINALPSVEDTRRADAARALAKVIEAYGDILDINPLRDVMEKLSRGAITHDPL